MTVELSSPVTLPCGLTLPNRIVKAAMAEGMSKHAAPSEIFEKTYEIWGNGGWGMVMTGNVQVDDRYLGSPRDLYVPKNVKPSVKNGWKRYATSAQASGTPVLVQLNHPGRQSPAGTGQRAFWSKSQAPSAVGLNLGSSPIAKIAGSLVFGTPKAMTQLDIDQTVEDFAHAATTVYEAGFAGVEIHAAHGYLLAQFMSPKINRRTDAYGGTALNRAKIAVDIIKAIRRTVPPSFCVAIKLNSADHQNVVALEEALEQIGALVNAGIDFLEISGGTYEDPTMTLGSSPQDQDRPVKASTVAREAFFLEFAKATRQRFPEVKLMLTGGFRTRAGMAAALKDGACDVVGVGRPACVNPSWPKDVIFNPAVSDAEAHMLLGNVKPPLIVRSIHIPAINAGLDTAHYQKMIPKLSRGKI